MKTYSLKTKICLTVSVLITILTLAMARYAFSYFEDVYKKTVAQQNFLLVENMAREIDDKLDGMHTALKATSRTVSADIINDPEKAQALLDSNKGLSTLFDNHIFLFSVTGRIIAESPYEPGRRGMDISHREYIQMTLKTARPYVGAPYISSLSHHHPAIMMTAPVYDETGQIIAIMGGAIDLMKDNFLGTLPYARIGTTGYFYLYNTDGVIIVHPDAKRILKNDVPAWANMSFDRAIQGFKGTEEGLNSRGVSTLTSFKRLNNAKWILAANQPVDEIYAPLIEAQEAFAVAAPLGILLIVFAVWYVVRRMIIPLELFTDHVNSLGSKRGKERFSTVVPNDEIGALARAFNKMLAELDINTASLEKSKALYRRQNRHLTCLHEISLGVMNRLDVNDLLVAIVTKAGELVGTPNGFIYLLDAAEGVFVEKVGLGIYEADVGRKLKIGEGLVSKVVATGQTVVVNDYNAWPDRVTDPFFTSTKAVVQVPLKSGTQIIGTIGMAFSNDDRKFGEEEVMIMSRFAEMASIAIDNARLYTTVQQELSDRKRAEAALREVNDNLEGRIEQRTQELFAANQELAAVNEEHVAMNEELIKTNDELQKEIVERERVEYQLADANKELTTMNEELRETNGELGKEIIDRQNIERELTKAIKDLQTMQVHLIQSEKMAALGSLVAGVAHEINTPVGVSVTASSHLKQVTEEFLDLCRNGAPLRQDLIDYLENLQESSTIILKNLERAGKLIRSFKQVSVDQSSETRRVFNIKKYLAEILLSMKPTLRKTKHRIRVECEEELNIDGFPGAFGQVVTNLIMNSLAHAYGPEDTGNIRVTVKKDVDKLVFTYSDDGKGMERNVLDRIFDPFFTTKRGAGGTGLGMYVVYNIVTQQFGGTIECISAPGKGANFRICLPIRKGDLRHGKIG